MVFVAGPSHVHCSGRLRPGLASVARLRRARGNVKNAAKRAAFYLAETLFASSNPLCNQRAKKYLVLSVVTAP
jgi:hypothetical protein